MEYIGAIHIHSDYSDGSKSIPEIAAIADSVGLDFLLFADHMTLQPLADGLEGWHGKVLVLIGYEINDPDNRNHYLAYNLREIVEPGLRAKDYVRLVKKKGGIGFIAHPDEVRTALPDHPSYPWTEWSVDGFDGIEVWNHMSEWMEGLTKHNKLWRFLSPRRALKGPTARTLKWWDDFNQQRKVVGIGGIDVHAFPYKLGPMILEIFPYKVQLKSIRTHLLLEESLTSDVHRSKEAIYRALTQASAFVSHYRWGDARGFRFWAEREDQRVDMGDTIASDGFIALKVTTPQRADIRLIKDGVHNDTLHGTEVSFPVQDSGLYRVEVFRRGRAWIYSNHIRVE
ncbi:MAG: PHP domain-containing protein [Gemmatimonadota bacterium]|nr:MAG: PHP domain-containing protein [Gemmatimonadota bacterium]